MSTLRRLLLSVAIGGITTVLVAWVFACTTDRMWKSDIHSTVISSDPSRPDAGTIMIVRAETRGSTTIASLTSGPNDWDPAFAKESPKRLSEISRGVPASLVNPWGAGLRPWPAAEARDHADVVAWGWPLRALWYSEEHNWKTRALTAMPGSVASGLVLKSSTLTRWTSNPEPALPLRPLWAGLLIDIALYTACAATLISVPGYARRWRRERRGWCRSCGYDLNHETEKGCPECGSGMPAVDS